MPSPRQPSAFTLIELLVVIAIIGVLATIATLYLGSAQISARNSRAQSDVTELSKAVEVFKAGNDNQMIKAYGANTASPNYAALPPVVNGDYLIGSQDANGFAAELFANLSGYYSARAVTTPGSGYVYSYQTTSTISNQVGNHCTPTRTAPCHGSPANGTLALTSTGTYQIATSLIRPTNAPYSAPVAFLISNSNATSVASDQAIPTNPGDPVTSASNPMSSPSGANPSYSFSDADRASRLKQLHDALLSSVTSTKNAAKLPSDQWEASANPRPIIRDLANLAFGDMIMGRSTATANQLIAREFAAQDLNPASPNYGELPWQIGTAGVVDHNADDFGNQAIGPLLILYANQLDPALVNQLKTVNIPAAYEAMKRYDSSTKVTYTNIFLMKATDMVLEGEVSGDTAMANDGYSRLDAWTAYTKTNGLREFESPTYYGTDLNSLTMGYLYTKNSHYKAVYKTMLDYFWTDIAANDFFMMGNSVLSNGDVSAPHSRDYDFSDGLGGLNIAMWAEGFNPTVGLGGLDFEKLLSYQGMSATGAYLPSAATLSLAISGERTVWEQTGLTGTYNNRQTYMNGDYSIGTTSSNYDAQDKPFGINLFEKGTYPFPEVSIEPSQYDDPYGLVSHKDATGHDKPSHTTLNPLFVQNKGAVLAQIDVKLRDIDPGAYTANVVQMSTSVILPARIDALMYQGSVIQTSPSMTTVPISGTTATFGIRYGSAAVVVRVFHVGTCEGAAPTLTLQSDPSAYSSKGAMRLKIAHNCPASAPNTGYLPVGFLIVAGHAADNSSLASFIQQVDTAPITDTLSSGDWQVSAQVEGVTLAGDRKVGGSSTDAIIARMLNGQPQTGGIFTVNGTDVASPVWAGLP